MSSVWYHLMSKCKYVSLLVHMIILKIKCIIGNRITVFFSIFQISLSLIINWNSKFCFLHFTVFLTSYNFIIVSFPCLLGKRFCFLSYPVSTVHSLTLLPFCLHHLPLIVLVYFTFFSFLLIIFLSAHLDIYFWPPVTLIFHLV